MTPEMRALLTDLRDVFERHRGTMPERMKLEIPAGFTKPDYVQKFFGHILVSAHLTKLLENPDA